MKIIKPMKMSLLHKTYGHRGQWYLVVTPIVFFRLNAHAELVAENEGWPKLMQSLPAETAFDLAMPKPSGEFLLAATAFAPGGRPCRAMDVVAAIGDVEKRLTVVGERQLRRDKGLFWQISETEPFTEMPIDDEHAWGGEAFDENPKGRGFVPRFSALRPGTEISLPNVQYPDMDYRRRRGERQIAGFGPLDLRVKSRRALAGTYGRRWLRNDFPQYAPDIDWRLFNVAPADQRVDGYFSGGESYRLVGMHPTRGEITGTLPAFSARCFLQFGQPFGGAFVEVPTVLDTVWFCPDKELGALLYRGQTAISDSDALDVEGLMLAYEHRSDVARSVEHYRDVWQLRTDPETALAHVFNESQLSPRKSDAMRKREEQEWNDAQTDALADKQAAADQALSEICAKPGTDTVLIEAPKVEPGPISAIPDAALRRADVDLSRTLAEAHSAIAALEAQRDETLAQIKVLSEDAEDAIAEQDRDARVTRAETIVYRDDDSSSLTAADTEHADRAIERAAREARRASPSPAAPEPSADAAAASQLRQLILRLMADGASLAGRDFAGADLSHVNLSEADLHDAMLEGANLSHCDLSGANLNGAVLAGARIHRANFRDAVLRNASLASAQGRHADFSRTDLSGCNLMHAAFAQSDFSGSELTDIVAVGASFTGCSLDGAELQTTLLVEADCGDADWQNASLRKTMFIESSVRNNDFSDAALERCLLANADARGARFRGANLNIVQFAGDCDLQNSDFSNAHADQCGFRKADMQGSQLENANLLRCDFGDVTLSNADLNDVCLYQSLFSGTSFAGSRLHRADFHDAQLRKANFEDADLLDVSFLGASLSELNLEGAVCSNIHSNTPWELRE